MSENKIFIMKNNDNVIYVGKTKKGKTPNIKKSNISYSYSKKSKINGVEFNKIEVIELLDNSENWFNVKLNYIQKYKNDNDLLNAKYLIDNKKIIDELKNGWWKGRIKDKHTINRLSESKEKKVVSYDENGENPITYKSMKEVGLKVFKDYKVINGSGKSRIYGVLSNRRMENRFSLNKYWFFESEIIDKYNSIIPKIPLLNIIIYEYDNNKKLIGKYHKLSDLTTKYGISSTGIKLNCLNNNDNLIRMFKTNTYFSFNNFIIFDNYPRYLINQTKNIVLNMESNKFLIPEKRMNGLSFRLSNKGIEKRFYMKTS